MKFTEKNVLTLKPEGADVWIADEGTRGFGIRFRNGVGTYTVRCSVQGKQLRMPFGVVGSVPYADARQEAMKALALVAAGKNPVAERAKEATGTGILFSQMIPEFLTWLRAEDRTEAYVKVVDRSLNIEMKPLHQFSVGDITRGMVAKELNAIAVERPRQAGIIRSIASAYFNWMVMQGVDLLINPVEKTQARPSTPRTRVLAPFELALIWKATAPLTEFHKVVRLLMLTGARRSQIAALTEREFKRDEQVLDFSGTRMKNGERFTVPLSRQAMNLLTSLTYKDPKGFMFSRGIHGNGNLGYCTGVLRDEVNCAADPELEHWTLHDFRRSFMTLGEDVCKIPHHIADACLSHIGSARSGVKRHYNHAQYLDERREALQTWADYLEGLDKPDIRLVA